MENEPIRRAVQISSQSAFCGLEQWCNLALKKKPELSLRDTIGVKLDMQPSLIPGDNHDLDTVVV